MVYNLKASGARAPVSVYNSGATVYRQGDVAGALYVVKFGCILLSRVTRTGTRQVSGFFLPGEAFGWEIEPEHRFTAEAAGTTSVETFGHVHTRQAAEWRQSQLVPSLANLRDQLMIISRPTADARVAAFLDDMMKRQRSTRRVYLPMHRFDIADYLGLSPETISRVLRRFQESELIRSKNIHVIDALDPEQLWKIYNK